MKQKILNIVLFIPSTIALILGRLAVKIPLVKYWAIDKICLLLKTKEEKELYLLTLSEAPKNEGTEKLGRLTLAQIEQVDIKVECLENLFGLNKKDYAHIVSLNNGKY